MAASKENARTSHQDRLLGLISAVAAGDAAREDVVAEGLEASKAFIAELCRAQSELAAVAAKETREFPVFLDYHDDVLDAVSAEVGEGLAHALTIADKQALTRALLRCGAPISDINTVRKHLSRIKGGRLAAALHPAPSLTLCLSDVPGDDPSVIASGR